MSLLSNYTDIELLELLKCSSSEAFNELYNKYWSAVYCHAMKIIRSKSDAEDIVQDFFASLWRRRAELEVTGSFEGYMFTSVKYLCIHFLEKSKESIPFRQYFSDAIEQAFVPTFDTSLDIQTMAQNIDGIIDSLPNKMKEVFSLSRKRFLSHKEIAQQLNISEKTVKKQVNNAIKVIRTNLDKTISVCCIIAYFVR